jgi:CRISPR-associated protein Cas2
MMVLVSYDVSTTSDAGKKRLRQVATLCKNMGQRVQFSLFECLVDPMLWARLRAELLSTVDPAHDSLRFYFLGADWKGRVEHHGAKPAVDPEGPLIA